MIPTSTPVLRSALLLSLYIAAGLLLVAGGIGFAVDGGRGLLSAAIGVALAVGFMAITAASILLANRFADSELFVGAFFGIVLGGWLLKFVLFLVAVFVLRDAEWINPVVLFLSIVGGVLGSLVVDVVVISRSNMLYASDVKLPRQTEDSEST